ncbi:CHAT domain-containing protein [Amycolatopsis balhimycina DSM 5908]|uniref:CHAT domain-containing protein n=1 Tax=Amycolatopsis balhimycina DSM 5908 TaxID=1081091 RepID=A0A428WNF2_AMYBA|nr:CHAT domain-containing protein [Amycolatopsis balhimycina]RSM44605.1 CHAT domain-containing protein [Amycolatopsis balhimycina DSM 5908]
MHDDVRSVVENFEYSGDVGALLTAALPAPSECPRNLLPYLARAYWHRYRAQSGFDGLADREVWASLAGERADLAVAGVTSSDPYWELMAARAEFDVHQDTDALVALVNAYTAAMESVDDERMKAALTVDQAGLLLRLDELDGTNRYAERVVNALDWAVARTPRDDPQRARRLVDRARAQANAGRRPGQVLAGYRAAAQLALRESPVWRDVVVELAQYEADLYANGGAPIHLAGALVACRDLAGALERDFGDTAALPALAQLEHEVSSRIGPDVARFLRTCHRDPDVLRAQRDKLEARKRQDIGPGVLLDRRDQAWLLALGLPLDHEGRLDALMDLYRGHSDLWVLGGDHAAIGLAYDTVTEAQLTTSPGDAGKARLHRALAHAASTFAVQTGSPDDAKIAVDAARALVRLPAQDDGERALWLSTLAFALERQYELGANPAAGREAVALGEEAISLTPPGDENLPVRWSALSTAARRVAENGDHELFAKAVEAGAQAVRTIPADDVRRVGMLYNYAAAVQVQATSMKVTDEEPYREAEQAYRAALALLPAGHPDHPRIESTIADLLGRRYRHCGHLDALDDALELAEKAVRETPPDHHWWPVRALALAWSARELATFGGPRAGELRELAITHYRSIGAHPAATAQQRMLSEKAQAAMLAEAAPSTWLDAQERVIAAIPATVSRALPWSRRLDGVRLVDGLADQVVHAGVRSGELDRAVALVEQCRAVLFGDAWGIRRGWAKLREVRPRLADELSQVESDLDEADSYADLTFHIEVKFQDRTSAQDWDPRPQAVERIRRLAARRAELLETARGVPGLENLLRPPDPGHLRERLAGHTAVVVSATGTALVVPGDRGLPVEPVSLRQLSEVTVRAQVGKLRAALAAAKDPASSFDRREQAQLDVHAVLEWLWDTTAGPILDRIPDTRLWWCPIGVAAGLPLHAAGRHREEAGRTVFDRVVSSYTPSLTALADTVATPRPHHARATALVVGVGEREGVPVLPGARAEAEAVAAALPGSTLLLDADASADAIKQGLHEHAIAHFACHGRAAGSDRHRDTGGLVIAHGLFVPSFVRDLRTTRAQLAFLSACDTAGPDRTLLDEPLNLASAFHLAGFRGVIGTLWHTADSTETATAVYDALTAHGSRPADTPLAASALTETLRHMRDAYPAVPARWAAHVHVGD